MKVTVFSTGLGGRPYLLRHGVLLLTTKDQPTPHVFASKQAALDAIADSLAWYAKGGYPVTAEDFTLDPPRRRVKAPQEIDA